MMNDRELKALARKVDTNPATLEKDYALTWLLRGFYQEKSLLRESFVMKGGTSIRKAYYPDTWRFSEDLDFTVVKKVGPDLVREAMQQIFAELLKESRVRYELDTLHFRDWAIMSNLKYTGPLDHWPGPPSKGGA